MATNLTIAWYATYAVDRMQPNLKTEISEENRSLKIFFKDTLTFPLSAHQELEKSPPRARRFSEDCHCSRVEQVAAAAGIFLDAPSPQFFSRRASSCYLSSREVSPVGTERMDIISDPLSPRREIEVLCVGLPLNPEERNLVKKSQEAVHFSSSGLDPRIQQKMNQGFRNRGTYFFKHAEPDVYLLINEILSENDFSETEISPSIIEKLRSNPKVKIPTDDTIQSNGIRFVDSLLDLNIQCAVVYKPVDGVLRTKDGIPRKNLIPNEVIVSGLSESYPRSVEVELLGHRGALMSFIHNASNFCDLSPEEQSAMVSIIPRAELGKLIISDLRFCNTDGHAGNLMCSSEGAIYSIDHGLVLSEGFQAGGVFIWMHWPVSFEPFLAEELFYIQQLNFENDFQKIHRVYPDYPLGNLEAMKISYYVLKTGAANGLSPFEIGFLLKGDLMGSLYLHAKENTDPNTFFGEMTRLIDVTIFLLKTNFARFKAEVQQHVEGGEDPVKLCKKMEEAKGLFNPVLPLTE